MSWQETLVACGTCLLRSPFVYRITCRQTCTPLDCSCGRSAAWRYHFMDCLGEITWHLWSRARSDRFWIPLGVCPFVNWFNAVGILWQMVVPPWMSFIHGFTKRLLPYAGPMQSWKSKRLVAEGLYLISINIVLVNEPCQNQCYCPNKNQCKPCWRTHDDRRNSYFSYIIHRYWTNFDDVDDVIF